MNNAQRIPVLMYHRIGPVHNYWERRFCVSPQRFAEHMQVLENQSMRPCSLANFFAWLRSDKELAEGSFLLTFDDGFLGVYEHAAPVLEEMGWPATVFLVSHLIGGEDEWCRSQNPGGASHPLMAQEHIEATRKMGFTFQSHTRLHPDLTTLSDEQVMEELAGSRQDLEEILGEPIPYLAYPYGRYNDRIANAACAAGYRAAFTVQPGFNRRDVHPFRISRIDVCGHDTPHQLLRKITLGTNNGSIGYSMRYYASRVLTKINSAVSRIVINNN